MPPWPMSTVCTSRTGQLAADCNRLGLQADKANARAKEAEQQLDGARQVAEAAKMRADKWQKEVEAAKAQPVEAVVDEEEIDRRAHKLAADLTAPLQEELDALKARPVAETSEDDLHNAYDSLLLIGRSMQNAWKSVKPQLQKLPAGHPRRSHQPAEQHFDRNPNGGD